MREYEGILCLLQRIISLVQYTHIVHFVFIGVYNLKTVECYLYATIKLGVGSVQMS